MTERPATAPHAAGIEDLPAGFELAGEHIAISLPGAHVLFTTRRGGFSRGPYASLNLGRLTDDDPGAVSRNRAAVEALVGAPLAYTRQVHGHHVFKVDERTKDSIRLEVGSLPEADGQATALRGVAPSVLVADCVPVAIAAPGAVAMVHAGWSGLAAGVIEAGVRAVRDLGVDGRLQAAIGPGAGPCCYEVGDEVHAVFSERFPAARRGDNLDLKLVASSRLESAGVTQVHDVGLCTMCAEPGLFYSHRRDGGITGRQAGIAWLS